MFVAISELKFKLLSSIDLQVIIVCIPAGHECLELRLRVVLFPAEIHLPVFLNKLIQDLEGRVQEPFDDFIVEEVVLQLDLLGWTHFELAIFEALLIDFLPNKGLLLVLGDVLQEGRKFFVVEDQFANEFLHVE
jgi:hypothetical protein